MPRSAQSKGLTIRQRLIVWYMSLLLVALSGFSGILYALLKNSLYSSADAALRSAAVNVARLNLQGKPGLWPLSSPRDLMERMLGMKGVNKYVQVIDVTGLRAPEWLERKKDDFPLSQLSLRNAVQGKLTYETFRFLGPEPVRVITMPVIAGGRFTGNLVQVGASLESVEQSLDKLAFTLMLALPGVMLLASVGGWFLANQALKPVDRITRTARQIGAESLKERLEEPETDDEIGRLAQTFNEMLQRLDESFDQIRAFTADASHELKTPLAILKGEIELALRRTRSVEEYQETLVSSLEEIDRLTRITADLLLLAKSDAGTIPLEFTDVNLSALVEEAAMHVQPLAESKQIIFEVLPGLSDVHIEGDVFRLKQLVSNLVDNAIHYTPEGGRVVVRSTRANSFYAALQVSDTGIGIPEEEREKIFERFYRTDKARSRREGGTGLGLSIVKWIAESHGGKIEIESAPQRGTTFTVYLPRRQGEKRQVPLGSLPDPRLLHSAEVH